MSTSTPTEKKYVAYYRVSTQRQGENGLGMDAQEATVADYIARNGGVLVGYEKEVESGRKTDRPKLKAAIAQAQAKGATLIIAKLDRLARKASFLLQLWESKLDIVACDYPEVEKFIIGIMALTAEKEAALISMRTKAALAAAKARGTQLGGWRGHDVCKQAVEKAAEVRKEKADNDAMRVGSYIRQAQNKGLSLCAIAKSLTEQGIQTARGGKWTAQGVKNIITRLDRMGA